jgi:hypothetical protein
LIDLHEGVAEIFLDAQRITVQRVYDIRVGMELKEIKRKADWRLANRAYSVAYDRNRNATEERILKNRQYRLNYRNKQLKKAA